MILPYIMCHKLREVKRIGSPDNWVFSVPVAAYGGQRAWVDRDDSVAVVNTALAPWVTAAVTPGVDSGKGQVDCWGDESLSVDNSSTGPRCREGGSVLQTEVPIGGGDRPVEESGSPGKEVTI